MDFGDGCWLTCVGVAKRGKIMMRERLMFKFCETKVCAEREVTWICRAWHERI